MTEGVGGPAPGGHGLTGVVDAGALLARLVRLDPAVVVRLRSLGTSGRTALWARLPWTVLVVRTVDGPGPGDATVSAADLLAELDRGGTALPGRRDVQWRWPLPPSAGRLVEALPAGEVRRIAASAAGTLRTAAENGVGGRAVGRRALRDALLDHVPILVTPQPPDGGPVEVTQRLIQGVVQLGFLGAPGAATADEVQVRLVGRWVGLAAPYGAAWSQKVADLALKPASSHPFG